MKPWWIFLILAAAGASRLQPQSKPDEFLKNFVHVDKTVSVPDRFRNGFESIRSRDLKSFLTFLASDLLEGRETATRGFDLACEYGASLFASWGIRPAGDWKRAPRTQDSMGQVERRETPAAERGFFQELAIREVQESHASVSLEVKKEGWQKTKSFVQDVDFTFQSSAGESLKAGVVFAGYGIREKEANYDDYKKLDVQGKIVMLLGEAPGKGNPDSPFQKGELKSKYFAPPFPQRRMGSEGFNKISQAGKMGALAVLLVRSSAAESGDVYRNILDSRRVNDERPIIPRDRRRLLLLSSTEKMPWESVPVVSLSRAAADEILGVSNQKVDALARQIDSTLKPFSFPVGDVTITLDNRVESTLTRSQNVLGYVEGSDPQLKDEVVVVGAHMDHLGKRGDYVFNGADDNGSGAVGILSLAHAMALNPEKPKRSVLFALWTGEENGLLGSRFYAQNPFFPLKKTVAYLNLDMISRSWDEKALARMARMMNLDLKGDAAKKIKLDNFLTLSLSAGAPELSSALKQAGAYVGMDFYLRESKSGGGGSDHTSFAMNKVPWIFFIAGLRDDYHQPSDSVEKVEPLVMERICRLVYAAAFLLADG